MNRMSMNYYWYDIYLAYLNVVSSWLYDSAAYAVGSPSDSQGRTRSDGTL